MSLPKFCFSARHWLCIKLAKTKTRAPMFTKFLSFGERQLRPLRLSWWIVRVISWKITNAADATVIFLFNLLPSAYFLLLIHCIATVLCTFSDDMWSYPADTATPSYGKILMTSNWPSDWEGSTVLNWNPVIGAMNESCIKRTLALPSSQTNRCLLKVTKRGGCKSDLFLQPENMYSNNSFLCKRSAPKENSGLLWQVRPVSIKPNRQ